MYAATMDEWGYITMFYSDGKTELLFDNKMTLITTYPDGSRSVSDYLCPPGWTPPVRQPDDDDDDLPF